MKWSVSKHVLILYITVTVRDQKFYYFQVTRPIDMDEGVQSNRIEIKQNINEVIFEYLVYSF